MASQPTAVPAASAKQPTTQPDSLLTTLPQTDTPQQINLHPLALLIISDYITRHISRSQSGPLIGALIGQTTGRTTTIEHAYECKTTPASAGNGDVQLDAGWFLQRLEQYKDVHKSPALDLVGIFMLGPTSGPGEVHAQFVRQVGQILKSESGEGGGAGILMLFHPEMVDELTGGRLPITLYESLREVEAAGAGAEEGTSRFREVGFEVETGEAEMIAVDFVATGAGNAVAVPKVDNSTAATQATSSTATVSAATEKKAKGKGKAASSDDTSPNGTTASATPSILSQEDEELIASLTAKANAIKMLSQRIDLIRAYLASQPQSYLTSPTIKTLPPEDTTNYTLLRSINAMISRLPLLSPPSLSPASDTAENGLVAGSEDKETQNVNLTTLLSTLTGSLLEAQHMGAKYHIYARDKASKERDRFGGAGGGGGADGRGTRGDGRGGGGMLGYDDGAGLLNSSSSVDAGGF